LSAVSISGLPNTTDTDILEKLQQKVMKMIKMLEHVSHEEQLRELGLINQEEKAGQLKARG